MRQCAGSMSRMRKSMMCHGKMALNRRSKCQESFSCWASSVSRHKEVEETRKRAGLARVR